MRIVHWLHSVHAWDSSLPSLLKSGKNFFMPLSFFSQLLNVLRTRALSEAFYGLSLILLLCNFWISWMSPTSSTKADTKSGTQFTWGGSKKCHCFCRFVQTCRPLTIFVNCETNINILEQKRTLKHQLCEHLELENWGIPFNCFDLSPSCSEMSHSNAWTLESQSQKQYFFSDSVFFLQILLKIKNLWDPKSGYKNSFV